MKSLRCFVIYSLLFWCIYVCHYSTACKSKDKIAKPSELSDNPDEPGNEVIFVCEPEVSEGHITRWVQRDNFTLLPNDDESNLTVILYENYTTIDFNCSENNPITSRALILKNTMRLFERNEYITDRENGSIACCLRFQDPEQKCSIRRNYLENKTMLLYQEPAIPNNYGSASFEYYYIGAAALVIIAVAIKVSLTVKKYRNKEMRESVLNNNTPAEKGPSIPLYADLDIPSPPQSARTISNEESPYAQITSPDMVSYTQMDPQDHYENVQVREAPYAQVMKKHR